MANNDNQFSNIKNALKQLIKEVLTESFSEQPQSGRGRGQNVGGELEQGFTRRRRRRGGGRGRVTNPTTDRRVKANRGRQSNADQE